MYVPLDVAQALTVLLALVYAVQGTVLSKVSKIALDSTRQLKATRVKALYAAYSNTQPFWVQLWNRTTGGSTFLLDWQVRVVPRHGDGSLEVSNLNESQYVEVDPLVHVLAIMNEQIPGPLNGNYRQGAGVVLSLLDRDHMGLPLNRSVTFVFDNLWLPYHLPVTLCNQTGCPYELGITTTVRPTPVAVVPDDELVYEGIDHLKGRESHLLSEEMMIGLVTWNIILTLLVLIIFLALVFICVDLEKRRKENARYPSVTSYSDDEVGFSPTGDFRGGLPGVLHYEATNPDMAEIRDDESDQPFSRESFEKMPCARF